MIERIGIWILTIMFGTATWWCLTLMVQDRHEPGEVKWRALGVLVFWALTTLGLIEATAKRKQPQSKDEPP